MTRSLNARLVADVVLAGIIAVALLEMRDLSENARFMPQLVAWVTLGLLALSILRQTVPAAARWMTPVTPRSDKVSEEQAEQPVPWPAALRVMGYVAGFWLLVLFLGLYVVPPILIVAYLVTEGRVPLQWAIISAAIATALTLLGLDVLGVSVWTGMAPAIVPDYVGGEVTPLF